MNVRKQFLSNVLPAMLSFAFSGVYAIVDGLFVGQSMGDMGLAAINVAYPIAALVQAVGTGIGMGGAIAIGICIGQENEEGQKRYLGNTLSLIGMACVAVTILLGLQFSPLLQMFGAQGDLLHLSEQYTRVIVLGATFQILGTGLVPIIRNYKGALVAMCAMIAGFLTNVLLDWLFIMVMGYGMMGAAVATIIGQAVTAVISMAFLLRKKKLQHFARYKPAKEEIRRILLNGLSPFGLTFSPNLVIVVINRGALLYGGDDAVACYAVVSYVMAIVQLLLQGVGDGCQPLLSRFYGAGNYRKMHSVQKMAYAMGGIVALASMAGIYALRRTIPVVFGVSPQLVGEVARVLVIFLLGFLFVAFLRVTVPYFYAVKQTASACLLIYGEPALLCILALLVFPTMMGVDGVWISVPVTQAVLTAVGIYLLYRTAKNRDANGTP